MMRILVVLIIIFLNFSLFSQEQIGSEILGINPNDEFGSGVAISDNGDIVAIGAHRRNSTRGIVEVYKNVNNQWELMGNKINGENENQWFGTSVALSSTGNRLAVGSYRHNITKIFRFESDDWVEIGEIVMDLSTFGTYSGYAVDLSQDGKTIAISAGYYPQLNVSIGIVNIYRELNGVWTKIGGTVGGELEGDQSGWDIALAENGNTVVLTSINNSNNGENSGQVRVFSYMDNLWKQRGESLYGESDHLNFGWSIAMSENGKYLIVGAPINFGSIAEKSHYVEVFQYLNGHWAQRGSKIFGSAGESFGFDVVISNDGNRIAISTPQNKACPIQIFDFIDNGWNIVSSINQEQEFSSLGFSIAMNPNGEILVGTSRTPNGYAVVYSLKELSDPDCPIIVSENETEETDSIRLYFPNVVSLNSENRENSVLFGQSNLDIIYSLKVFDRWGNLVFENVKAISNSMVDGWSPKSNSGQGTYVYVVNYTAGLKELEIVGDFTLVK